jgi:hypothetical protein
VVDFTTQVKKKNFEKAVKVLIKGSPLEERFAEGSPQRVELVTRLFQASEAYGHLISIDLIQTQKIGKVKRHIYFMNYSKSAIRLDVLFYKPKKVEYVVQYSLDDDLLASISEINAIKQLK